jgi:hypothetical protein
MMADRHNVSLAILGIFIFHIIQLGAAYNLSPFPYGADNLVGSLMVGVKCDYDFIADVHRMLLIFA